MKSRLALLALLLPLAATGIPGCLQPAGKQTAPAVKTDAAFWTEAADAIEHGSFSTTQQAVKGLWLAAKKAGAKFPDGYNAALGEYLKTNRPLTDSLRSEMAGKIRGLVK